MTPHRNRLSSLTVALTALAIGACTGSLETGSPLTNTKLPGDIGVTARDEVESSINSLTLPSSLGPVGTARTTPGASPSCVTPSTATDSDGDGVPDDAIYIFTAPPCRFSGWRGGTLDIVGQLRVQDPAPSGAGFGYEGTLTGLRTRFTSADKKTIYDITRNGTRTLSGSASALTLSADLQMIRTFVGQPDAAIDQQWTVNYTPGASAPDQRAAAERHARHRRHHGLDPGHRELRPGGHHAHPAALQRRLHRHGAADRCRRARRRRHHRGVPGSVRVRWSGCGKEPSYSFVAAG